VFKVPSQCVPWPSEGTRRISVNSFGMGGTNAHIIIDDAYSYLSSAGLKGHHQCNLVPCLENEAWSSPSSIGDGKFTPGSPSDPTDASHKLSESSVELVSVSESIVPPNAGTNRRQLLVWSAADESSMGRVFDGLKNYYSSSVMGSISQLHRLSWTLSDHRTHLSWRSFAVIDGTGDETELTPFAKTERSPLTAGRIVFIFTGQGAQYAGMGIECLEYDVFRQTLSHIDQVFTSLGASWSLFGQ
jgi:acyl transferase domain-containing protein